MARTATAKLPVEPSQDDLRRAFRECRLVQHTFESAMEIPSIATAVRRLAEARIRREQRLQELLRSDRKLAQANDCYDQDAQ